MKMGFVRERVSRSELSHFAASYAAELKYGDLKDSEATMSNMSQYANNNNFLE
jgi:hypothetical protein